MDNILSLILNPEFFFSGIRVSTPIILAAMAAVISTRAGLLNIALDGTMLISALTGVLFSAWTQNVWIGFFMAVFIGGLFGYIMAFLSLRLGVDIILAGIAINLLGSGGTIFLLYAITGDRGASTSLVSKVLPSVDIPLIKDIPIIGQIFSGQNIAVYLAFLSVIVLYFLLFKTKVGLRIRAVGENPNAANSVGINVYKIQMFALILSGIFAGIAGSYMSMGYLSWFSKDMTAGRGWIAIAASTMGGDHPIVAMLASLFFGMADALGNYLKMMNLPSQLVEVLPYVLTIIGLCVYSYNKFRRQQRKIFKTAKG